MDIAEQLKIVMDYLRPGVAGLIRRHLEGVIPLLRVVPETSLDESLLDAVDDDWVEGACEALRLGATGLRTAVCQALFLGHTRCATEIRLHSATWGQKTQKEIVHWAAAGGHIGAASLSLSWARADMLDVALAAAAAGGHIPLMRMLRGRGALTRDGAFVEAARHGQVAALVELSKWPAHGAFAMRMVEQKSRELDPYTRDSLPAIAFESWVAADIKRSRRPLPRKYTGGMVIEPFRIYVARKRRSDEKAIALEDKSHHSFVAQRTADRMYRKHRFMQMISGIVDTSAHFSALRAAVAAYQVEAADWLWHTQRAPDLTDDREGAVEEGYGERAPALTKEASDAMDSWMAAHVPGFAPRPVGQHD